MDENEKKEEAELNQVFKSQRRHIANFLFIFLMTVLLISVYTFILQNNYSKSTLDAAVTRDSECSDAIHRVVSNKFTRTDFTEINSRADMESARYKELQESLNELRGLNSTRYLYTAKKNEEGRLVYLIDGLDLDAEDFAYPGTYIEDEMIPYIERALAGENVYSQKIVDTTWGHIFTACYPILADDGSGEIVGALCIEIDMESTYQFLDTSSKASFGVAAVTVIFILLLATWIYMMFQKQKKKEEEQQELLEATASAAEAANRAKSTFLFNMSHDIRTPMNAIIGYAELTKNHLQEPEKMEKYLENIRVCGQRMLAIIDNVLELARIENNKIVLEESVSNVEDSLDSCIVMFENALEKKQQHLTVEKEIVYPYVYMDISYVTEIMLNILSNAIKYTGEGGNIFCSLKQRPHQEEGWCIVEMTIRDTGIGMSKEFQEHIFESFSRERSSTVSGVDGTGLGMGIVKKLVDMMNGTIRIQSQIGKGSTFVVSIPCRIARKEEAQPKRAGGQIEKGRLKGKRILLAEDNDLNAEIAMELLGEEGLQVERAKDGVLCVEMLEKAEPAYYDMILMDIQMPVMNGYLATQKIRKLKDPAKANIPIIAMTANAFSEDRQKAIAVGMSDHVAKPIDMNVLIPTIKKYL